VLLDSRSLPLVELPEKAAVRGGDLLIRLDGPRGDQPFAVPRGLLIVEFAELRKEK
jgi:hypothetical protein